MAPFNPQTQKCLLPLATFFLLLFLNPTNSYEEVSFYFQRFTPKPQINLITQGDVVYDSNGWLRLNKATARDVPLTYNIGRVLYSAPIHIWDSVTGNVANFETSFQLFVRTPNPHKTADGITFFLAPVDSQIPIGSTGGYLGVFSPNRNSQVVAVEFDTYSNSWDPNFRHIGIDVGNISSIKTARWRFRNEVIAHVTISYESKSKTLTTSAFYSGSDEKKDVVSDVVDFKNVLPEWVRVGFSGTTGLSEDFVQNNYVNRWKFSSNIESYDYSKRSATREEPNPKEEHIALYAES